MSDLPAQPSTDPLATNFDGTDHQLRVDTDLGAFTIQLYTRQAPQTSRYFLHLADSGALNQGSIFRIVAPSNVSDDPEEPNIQVVQVGRVADMTSRRDQVPHESTRQTGLRHHRWAVSAARFDTGELYRSFFVCMRDEPCLDFGGRRAPDGEGFAVFGSVIDGYTTLDSAFARAEKSEMLTHPPMVTRIARCGQSGPS